MMKRKLKIWEGGLAICLLFCIIFLAYFVEQSDFWRMLPVFGLAFGIYAFILSNAAKQSSNISLQFWIIVAILLRFALVFGMPNLSDDIYRFIWDGHLLNNGINPFTQLPSELIQQNNLPQGITPTLFEGLNSPDYYTIYPPIAQLTFLVATWLFPESILGSAIVMKSFSFLFEIGNIYLIVKLLHLFKLNARNVLIYALNPLIILELTGNLHFEGAMIFFLLLAIYHLVLSHKKVSNNNQNFTFSAIAFALSIASKLLPLMFLPLFIKRLGWKKSIHYFLIIGGVLLLLFFPLINGVFVSNFGDSLDLYFRKFEFNASVYYVIRWLGFQLKGFNLIAKIGPALALCTLLTISWLSFKQKIKSINNLPLLILLAITTYLTFTTTVHPWYVSLPLVLCCFTSLRFPVIWSGLIFLTYINYSYPTYQENLWIVAVEYVLVGSYFLWEILSKRVLSKIS